MVTLPYKPRGYWLDGVTYQPMNWVKPASNTKVAVRYCGLYELPLYYFICQKHILCSSPIPGSLTSYLFTFRRALS
jgi:hypothetical protein